MKTNYRKKIVNVLQYLLVIFIILSSETIWEKMPNKSLRDHFSIIAYGGVSLLLFLLISLGRKKIKNNFLISVFGAILYLIILVIVNLLIYKINLALLFTIPTALMILYFSFNLGELSSVMEKTYNIIYIIALTSLIIFIPYVLLGILDAPTLFPFLRNNWTQYAPSFYIYSYPQGNRNCAFFYEAPKYNVILTLALAYSCYIKKECLTFKNIIIFCTILSAQSVTGILLSIFIIVTKAIFESDHYKIGKNNIILILSPIILIIALIASANIFSEKITSGSGIERLLDCAIGLAAWKENIVWGAGIGNNSTIDSVALSYGREFLGFSNGTFRILAQGGIYLFLFFLVPFLKLVRLGFKQKRPYVLFYAFVFLAMIFTTSFSNTMIYALHIVFFSLFEKSKTINKRPIYG